MQFDLSGGHPALDLTNTLSSRGREVAGEGLTSFTHLLEWARQGSLIDDALSAELRTTADRSPSLAAATLRRTIDLREALFRLFESTTVGQDPPATDLALFNRHLGEALAQARLLAASGELRWDWERVGGSLDRVLWPVVRAAADLLTSPLLERVRVCGAETCRWLFLDHSRNQSRVWCDMSTCGNRAKARRHYSRSRQPAAIGPGD